MRVILHIGAPKTGTSAIQYFLHQNRQRLQKYGFYYPQHNFDKNNVSGGHADFGAAISNDRYDDAQALVQRWLKEAVQASCDLLLSAEAMYRRPEIVAELFKNHEIKVLAYFRHPLESLVSNHNQSIKRHFSTVTLTDFLYKQVGVNNRGVNGRIFKDWQDTVGKERISIRAYHQSQFYKQRIELDFLKRLGVSGWSAKRFKLTGGRVNSSYTSGALEIKRLLNGILDTEKKAENTQLDRTLQAFSDSRQRKKVGREKTVIHAAIYSSINDYYQTLLKDATETFIEDCPEDFMTPQSVAPAESMLARSNLKEVLEAYDFLCEQLPELMAQLKQRLLEQIQECVVDEDADELPYALLKLAEIMSLPIREPKPKPSVPSASMKVFLSDGSSKCDYLREVAKWLELHDQTESAIEVLEQSLKIAREQALGPKKMRVLERLLNSYQQRLAAVNETTENAAIVGTDPN